MYTPVGDADKRYPKHVNKLRVPVIARVGDSIVQGMMHLTSDNRVKDELNGDETFIAITEARVWELHGERPLYETTVLLVNKNHIAWIFPRGADAPASETAS